MLGWPRLIEIGARHEVMKRLLENHIVVVLVEWRTVDGVCARLGEPPRLNGSTHSGQTIQNAGPYQEALFGTLDERPA